ncbi:BON domain-containing protein [Saccharospirillum mangrovi]|uniref:BON domain-containing protein n=1 Tax=Saccharospirillum mangrovi TaxID=2161747 RepID=UPI000D364BB2|nr:BON domain-containing protein [Saccharospirillum mangrovi]
MKASLPTLALTLSLTLGLTGCASILGGVSGDEPITPNPQGRSMGEVIDDKSLATRLEVNLNKASPGLQEGRIQVYANAGIILLVGQVASDALVRQASEVARHDPAVKAVHNHLSVGQPLSAGVRANDSWLAVKVRSRMFTRDNFPSSHVEVIVEAGVVYLMGRVNEQTSQQAAQIATEVNGVQRVVTVFSRPASANP